MSSSPSAAAKLSPDAAQRLAISALSKAEPISHLAEREEVSRTYIYRQKRKALNAVEEAYAANDADVLFYLPVTEAWLSQLMVALPLICHSSYRGIQELLRDVFDIDRSIGTIHNRVQAAAVKADILNRAQDLSGIRVGLPDEIFQGSRPVLAGVDAASTYCYLLAMVEHRDEEAWRKHLAVAHAQGFDPDYTIADAGKGIRAGQKAVLPDTPLHGDVFHIQKQCETLGNLLSRLAKGATSYLQELEKKMKSAKDMGRGNTLSKALAQARQAETQAVHLARDVKTLIQWLSLDVLALAGPALAERQELYDFIVAELRQREPQDSARIRPVRTALARQRDALLAFAGVLDKKLVGIAQACSVPLRLVREVCLLQRKSPGSPAFWLRRNQLHKKLADRFHRVSDAVKLAMTQTPRASSLVENLNSRLRNYFFLRHQLGTPYLDLLRFFLNHRTFLRSRRPERKGKSPAELMTGQRPPHWLELLGFTRFQRT
jgi:hypothetical protein